MGAGHVVGDGPEVAGFGQVEGALFFGDDVAAEEQAAVFHAVDVLGHLAFAAAGCALVHEDELVFVGRDDGDGGAVVGGPALALANVEQDGVDAFFGAGAGVEVVGEDFLVGGGAVVDDDLAAGEVGVAEGRRDKEDAAGDVEVGGDLVAGNHALQIGERGGEEGGLAGNDEQRAVAEGFSPGIEGHGDEFLVLEPVEGLLAGLVEGSRRSGLRRWACRWGEQSPMTMASGSRRRMAGSV